MRRGRGSGLALGLLFMNVLSGFSQYGLQPVTSCVLFAQVAIFMKLFDFLRYLSLSEVCISAVSVWYRADYKRLFMAAFFHMDEWHLYFNMVSFWWKGNSLEKKLGSAKLLYMIIVFTFLCNSLTVALAMVCEHLFNDQSYLAECAVGFSGVIFALKVITTNMMPPNTTHYLLGFIPIKARLAVWAELLLIQVMVPNASLLGHLAGILVGFLYLGPLKSIMDGVLPSPAFRGPAQQFSYSGSTGYRNQHNSASSYVNDYTGGLSEEEQMRTALLNSRNEAFGQQQDTYVSQQSQNHAPSSSTFETTGLYPDLRQAFGSQSDRVSHNNQQHMELEEVRRRRINRFQ